MRAFLEHVVADEPPHDGVSENELTAFLALEAQQAKAASAGSSHRRLQVMADSNEEGRASHAKSARERELRAVYGLYT
jgi:hypothetical protein